MVSSAGTSNKRTLLGYELTPHQDAVVNYLVPSVSACILYTLLIASDVAVVFSHHNNGDPVWASLTLFIMWLPVLGSFVIVVSNWELWPEFEGCGRNNAMWLCVKILEHLFFPVWSMWRFAERMFWSIEAVRAKDDDSIEAALSLLRAPRSIELYIFLQSYAHSLPQVLLQLYILMRHNATINRQTETAQFLSVLLNLAKVSITTTYYQRFKSQKLTGKQYPWYKHYKMSSRPSSQNEVVLRRSNFSQSRSVIEERRNTSKLEDRYDIEVTTYTQHRRSSDIYLEPSTSSGRPQTLLETNFEGGVQTNIRILEGRDEVDKPLVTSETRSAVPGDAAEQTLYRTTVISDHSEPDFNVSRVIYVKGLEDDDLAGKLIAFFWWFGFLSARVLAISVFAYFFMKEALFLLCSHFVLVIAFLAYDVKSDAVKRAKAVFFVFLAVVYVFCIIEFKVKFKKATFMYYGFFAIVFSENLVMCLIWYVGQMDSIENDFWFRYIFYIIIMCSLTSLSSMLFYFTVSKPPKVVVETRISQR